LRLLGPGTRGLGVLVLGGVARGGGFGVQQDDSNLGPVARAPDGGDCGGVFGLSGRDVLADADVSWTTRMYLAGTERVEKRHRARRSSDVDHASLLVHLFACLLLLDCSVSCLDSGFGQGSFESQE